MQIDLLTKIILPASLFLIMLGMGLSLKLADFKGIAKEPKAVGIGVFGQMILLPLLAFAVAVLFKLAPEISVGLIIISLVPGGVTSNMFTYLSHGDVALSISLTAIVSLVTPFTIPLFTAFSIDYFMGADANIQFPILKTIIQLLVITLVPVAIGMIINYFFQNAAAKTEKFMKWFSVALMFFIIGLIVHTNYEMIVNNMSTVGVATLILNVAALVLGYALARITQLKHSQTVTIGFEVGIQNGTLALVVAGTLLQNETMMIPGALYGLLMFVTGAAFSWWVNRYKKYV